jgi:hypothetical protein
LRTRYLWASRYWCSYWRRRDADACYDRADDSLRLFESLGSQLQALDAFSSEQLAKLNDRALAAATYVADWWLTNYGQVSDPIYQNVWDLWRKRWERCYKECEQRGLDYHRMFASLEEADAYLKMRKDLSHDYHAWKF